MRNPLRRRPVAAVDVGEAEEPAPTTPALPRPGRRRAEKQRKWLHRQHPVFTPLAGYFTGVVVVVLLLVSLGWVLRQVLGIDLSENAEYFLYAIGLLLVIDIGLIIWPRTRRFAKYMLAALIVTPIVMAGVGILTLYILIHNE